MCFYVYFKKYGCKKCLIFLFEYILSLCVWLSIFIYVTVIVFFLSEYVSMFFVLCDCGYDGVWERVYLSLFEFVFLFMCPGMYVIVCFFNVYESVLVKNVLFCVSKCVIRFVCLDVFVFLYLCGFMYVCLIVCVWVWFSDLLFFVCVHDCLIMCICMWLRFYVYV